MHTFLLRKFCGTTKAYCSLPKVPWKPPGLDEGNTKLEACSDCNWKMSPYMKASTSFFDDYFATNNDWSPIENVWGKLKERNETSCIQHHPDTFPKDFLIWNNMPGHIYMCFGKVNYDETIDIINHLSSLTEWQIDLMNFNCISAKLVLNFFFKESSNISFGSIQSSQIQLALGPAKGSNGYKGCVYHPQPFQMMKCRITSFIVSRLHFPRCLVCFAQSINMDWFRADSLALEHT